MRFCGYGDEVIMIMRWYKKEFIAVVGKMRLEYDWITYNL